MRKTLIYSLILLSSLQLFSQKISISQDKAIIENKNVLIEFDLKTGNYLGIDKSDNTTIFKDATFLLDRGQKRWRTPNQKITAEEIIGMNSKELRIWYTPLEGYDPIRFLDISVLVNSSSFLISWGVKNNFKYEVRVKEADVLFQGKLFEGQKMIDPKVLRGGSGAEPNFVEDTWEVEALNSVMLTYLDNDKNNNRKTIVAGGSKYSEFLRKIEIHEGDKDGNSEGEFKYSGSQPFITLSISDPQGKRVPSNTTWKSEDNFYLDFNTRNPFESLENYGKQLAKANNANPNKYNFPTLCGWMVSTKNLGEGKPINNSPGLVNQMKLAKEKGLNKYTSLAVRLEPDYYCYGRQGNTQQGWWDDEHWSKFGSLQEPYETFSKFSSEVENDGGQIFTYFQASMPSNDFAIEHPDWMLNDDISLIHTDHYHHRPVVRYDYTNADFQEYTLDMWSRLKSDGLKGIKFDYPETAWAWDGGFDDKTYTTTSAYRKLFELCREGLGVDAYIHERNLGGKTHENVYRLDCTAGIVDLQRVWGDASHFEPEMASRMGLRWYKQGIVYRYYPDGKSFYHKGNELSAKDRRTFLTLVGLLSGRIEIGTSVGSMTDHMFFDLTRLYPVLENGKSFRPVDFLQDKKHPEVYVYDVDSNWKQVILINNDLENEKLIRTPISGDQVTTGAIGFDKNKKYVVYDFWNENPLGVYSGEDMFEQNLDKGEALIYSVKELENHPQIIGTNRHVMCGMFEITDEIWEMNSHTLKFNASLIGDETMKVKVYLPKNDKRRVVENVLSDNSKSTYFVDGDYLTISLFNEIKNIDTMVEVKFSLE